MRQIERETDRVHVWVSQNVPNANVFNYQCDNKWERDNQLKMILIPFQLSFALSLQLLPSPIELGMLSMQHPSLCAFVFCVRGCAALHPPAYLSVKVSPISTAQYHRLRQIQDQRKHVQAKGTTGLCCYINVFAPLTGISKWFDLFNEIKYNCPAFYKEIQFRGGDIYL